MTDRNGKTTLDSFHCGICGESGSPHFYKRVPGTDGKEYELVRCDSCGMIVVWPLPTEEFLNAFYATSYQGKGKKRIIEWGDPLEANRQIIEDCCVKLKYIETYAGINQRGRLLDVGCGHGFFVHAAQMLGYEATGMDIDTEAISFARSGLGIDIMQKSIDSIEDIPAESFDVITGWAALEHFRRPGNFARQTCRLLKPGGIFAGNVPNVGGIVAKIQGTKWHLILPPEHLNYFNEHSIKQLLTKSGLTPLFVGTIPLYAAPYFSFGVRMAIMRLLRRTSTTSVEAISRWLHRSLTLVKRHLVYRPLNTLIIGLELGGDNLFFVARKGGNEDVGC